MNGPTRPRLWEPLVGRRGVWLAAGIIVLATLAVYSNSLRNPFVFDDQVALTQNPSIRQLWPLGEVLIPPPTSTLGGRPIANLSFALNYALGGDSPWGYHAVSLTLHFLTALLFFGIVRRSVGRIFASRCGEAVPIALTAALLWALHPLATGTVSYVSQRTELLMALFYLLTLYGFIRGLERSPQFWLPLSIAACALGTASKEVMVTAPFTVLLYDCAFVSGSVREAWRRRWTYYVGLGATWLLLAFLMSSQLAERSVGFGLGVSWWNYLLTECQAVVLYLTLSLWPHLLVFDYGPLFVNRALSVLPHAIVLAGTIGGVLLAWTRKPALGFVAGWFFIVLAPTSSVVPLVLQPIAENRAYLPLLGLVTLAVLGVRAVAGLRGLSALLALAALFGVSTIQRNETYRTESALWVDTIAKRSENPRAQTNLGSALFRQGHHSEAMKLFASAVRLDPTYPEAQNDLGYGALFLGDIATAIPHLQEAVRLRPNFAMARNNLAAAYNEAKRFAEALALGESALQLAPLMPEAHYNVGESLMGLGRVAESVAQFEAELRSQPEHANALYFLGRAFLNLSRPGDAIPVLEHVIHLTPDFAEAYNDLGVALLRSGRTDDAVAQFTACLRRNPNHEAARRNLAAIEAARAIAPSAAIKP